MFSARLKESAEVRKKLAAGLVNVDPWLVSRRGQSDRTACWSGRRRPGRRASALRRSAQLARLDLEQVAPAVGPVLGVLRSLQHSVDEPIAFVRVAVGQERLDFRDGRQDAEDVEGRVGA